ncbi:MAG: hypothetical protein NXI07_08765 [bacterium]|nr:hypothetical protein [bacterium]
MRTLAPISIVLCLALAALGLMPGCNVVTPVAYAIHGPGKVEPQYTLEENARTVVFVDDPSSRITQRRLRYAIAERATDELLEKRILVDMVDPRGILTAASNERYGKQMSISELGRTVDADIVIYAVVTDFSMSPETGAYLPRATMRVKIIDTRSKQRVWPADERGHVMNVQIPQRPGSGPASTGERVEVEGALASRAGLGLAQLFYKHEITETVLFRR